MGITMSQVFSHLWDMDGYGMTSPKPIRTTPNNRMGVMLNGDGGLHIIHGFLVGESIESTGISGQAQYEEQVEQLKIDLELRRKVGHCGASLDSKKSLGSKNAVMFVPIDRRVQSPQSCSKTHLKLGTGGNSRDRRAKESVQDLDGCALWVFRVC